jgi:hypothetical protein
MARILPERTVEAWATAYIVRWFPTALLWAPTQGDPLNWDASIALPNYRYFVFEYKAVEEGHPYPFISVDTAQLRLYKDVNDLVGATVVWYVLPFWEAVTVPGTFLPAEARLRTLRARHPHGLPPAPPGVPPELPPDREEHELGRGCEAYFYVADPAKMLDSYAINADAEHATLRVEDVPDVAEGVTLEHFLHLVDEGLLGVTWDKHIRPWVETPERETRPPGRGRFTTAFAVPSGGSSR